MTFLKNLWADLVDKRLLPVVAILIACLIAVPVVLGRAKDPETPAPAPAVAQLADVTSPGKVTLDPDGPKPEFVQRKAARRDPFARKVKPKKKAETVGEAVSNAVDNTNGAAVGPTDKTATTPKVTVPKTVLSRVSLQFGQTGAKLKTFGNVAKFTPLPSESNPLLIYNGIVENGKSASFLLSADVTPSGQGRCKPDIANCQTLVLSAGESSFFDVPSGTGGITQYELKILAVTSPQLASTAK